MAFITKMKKKRNYFLFLSSPTVKRRDHLVGEEELLDNDKEPTIITWPRLVSQSFTI